MTESNAPASGTSPKATLGLTGLTSNAMALIAPGAFLWLTFTLQLSYGKPIAGISMWFGILLALALCFATAISYAELSKLYPGAGSSYFFAEQAFLSKKKAFRWARLYKFMVGWASHLYYWVYPGVMVAVTAIVAGYLVGNFLPAYFNASIPSPLFMILFCIVFAYGVAYIAHRGVVGATGVNLAINIIQITALVIFSIMAIGYRTSHHEGAAKNTWGLIADTYGNNKAYPYQQAVDAKNQPIFNDDGSPKLDEKNPWTVSYDGGVSPTPDPTDTSPTPKMIDGFNQHITAGSVIHPHKTSYVFVQACIAILILVGFESVTSMGEEAKNPKKHIPWAVLLSLAIQGGFCYLFEYFAADYFLHNNYNATAAGGSAAPIGDMMQIVGAWLFGSTQGGWWFMIIEALTVFLALIGTTLSCINTGARVTYAMGRDEEVPSHFGLLHGKNATPHRAIWTLATISVVIGIFGVLFNFCGPQAQTDAAVGGVWHYSFWYKFGLFKNATAVGIPQSSLIITLVSNFGTFMLYMMTCLVAIVAFHEHHLHNPIKHLFIPAFGLLANLACMIFYIVGPYSVAGMSSKEPWWALAVAGVWGLYGAIYFLIRSKKSGKPILVVKPPITAATT